MSIIQFLINKAIDHDGEKCDDCKKYFGKLISIFTNNIGFKDVCDKCKGKHEFFYNKGLNKFPSKQEFTAKKGAYKCMT